MAPDALGDAERDVVAATLGRHYVAGRLDADELDARLGLVYADGDGGRALDGLPPLAAGAVPGRRGWLRRRGHNEADRAEPGWVPTTERFVDPSTARVMRVWLDGTGARRYVAEAPSG